MFTGIIDHTGTIYKIENIQAGKRFWIKTNFNDLVLGESIAVDGICLTVTTIQDNLFSCDISPETLNVTTAKHFKENKTINLERALQLSSRLGGHFVSGHIDQTAKIKQIQNINDFVEIEFYGIEKENMPLLNKKGSIAINGVSLTLNEITGDGFKVMLIPHTLEITNLSQLSENASVNLEFDMIAKIILNQSRNYKSI